MLFSRKEKSMNGKTLACALSIVVIGGCGGEKKATTPTPEPAKTPQVAPSTIFRVGQERSPSPYPSVLSKGTPSIPIPERKILDGHTAMYASFDATRDVTINGKLFTEGTIFQLLRPNHGITGDPKDGKWAMQPYRQPRRIALEIHEITPVASQYPLVWIAAPQNGRFPEKFKIGWYHKGDDGRPNHLDLDRVWVNGKSYRTGTNGVVTKDDRRHSYIERKTFMVPVSSLATP
ncbi:hypothetical protein HYW94_01375 [Candidatus Uhrbacteria bacterium]|nr:hypothetical protein [Candidatus Uhrbacteria bacterium]